MMGEYGLEIRPSGNMPAGFSHSLVGMIRCCWLQGNKVVLRRDLKAQNFTPTHLTLPLSTPFPP